jgi:hypothetical protein
MMILNMKSQGMDSSNVMNFLWLLWGFGLFHLVCCSLTIEIDTSEKIVRFNYNKDRHK